MKCQNWCKTTFEKRGSILVSCEVSRKRIHLRDRQYQRNVTQERNLPLKLLKCLTDLISALCSMATTSCSKDQALANLNLDKAIIYHLCRGFQKRPSHVRKIQYFDILTISRVSTKGAILPGVFEVTQESPSTEIMDRLGISTRASHACNNGFKILDICLMGVIDLESVYAPHTHVLESRYQMRSDVNLSYGPITSFLTWSGSGPIL